MIFQIPCRPMCIACDMDNRPARMPAKPIILSIITINHWLNSCRLSAARSPWLDTNNTTEHIRDHVVGNSP